MYIIVCTVSDLRILTVIPQRRLELYFLENTNACFKIKTVVSKHTQKLLQTCSYNAH